MTAETTAETTAPPYDFNSLEVRRDPWDLWASRRRECPVSSGQSGGVDYHFVARYDDVKTVAHNVDDFTTTEGTTIPAAPFKLLPIDEDGQRHRDLRRVINPLLAPQVTKELEGWLRERAREHVVRLAGQDVVEVCHEFSTPYVKNCMLSFLGFPDEDLPRLSHWTDLIQVQAEPFPPEELAKVGTEMVPYIFEHLARNADPSVPRTPLAVVSQATIDGEPLTDEEKLATVMLLIVASLSTTSAVLSGSLLWLADHPEERRRLRNEPDLMTTAVDEFVRYVSPVAHMGRTVTTDAEIAGCPVRAGDKVVIGYGSANRDEDEFDEPDTLLLHRHPNRHLGFGIGPHRCVGLHLAKVALRAGISEFLAQIPEFHVADRDDITEQPMGFGRELRTVPLAIGPA